MTESDRKTLRAGLTALKLDPDGDEAGKLERYISEIELWNPRYRLIAEGEDLVARHVLDSLAGLAAVRERSPRRMADVGSGAGFPGIPLALFLPGCETSLIEKMGRRAGFLRNAVVTLGLTRVSVLEKPVGELKPAEADFDVITFRAWSAIDAGVLDVLSKILAPGGVIAAYKGRRDAVDAELTAAADRIASSEIIPLESFGGGERHLVMMEPRKRI